MKKLLFLFTFLSGVNLHAAQQVKYVQISTGALQPGTTAGFQVSQGGMVNLLAGCLPITGATCTATTGGGLSTGSRLYWKAYAIPSYGSGSVSYQTGHGEMTMIPNGTAKAATLSWNTSIGATCYALTRASALAGPDGVIITTMTCSGTCVYVDTGATLSVGNPWPSTPYGSTSVYVGGGIWMGAGNMPIVWTDYNGSGELRPYIGPSSAGEFVLRCGLGAAKNTVYFNDTNDRAFWRFMQDPNDNSSILNGENAAGTDNHIKMIAGSSITFIVNNLDSFSVHSTSIAFPTTVEFKPGLLSSTSGQMLVSQGVGAAPKFQWAGQLLQIATGSVSASSATTSATFGDTNLSATITPRSTASVIKISVNGVAEISAGAQASLMTIARGSTNIAGGTNQMLQVSNSGGGDNVFTTPIVTTDKPQTTSATTYKLQFRVGGGATLTFCTATTQCNMLLEEIGQN